MNEFSISESETRTFGLNVFRAKITEWDSAFIQSWGASGDVDIIISRIDTRLQSKLFELKRLHSDTFLADALVYYSVQLGNNSRPILPEGISIRRAGSEDQNILEDLILKIFKGYKNHYHSNPLFSNVDLAKGYLEWSLPYLNEEDKRCLIISENGIPAGFLTAKLNSGSEPFGDIILNGIVKAFEGRGYYSLLLRELKFLLSEARYKRLIVSTQLNNQRVQAVWAKEGLTIYDSFYTFHHFLSHKSRQSLIN